MLLKQLRLQTSQPSALFQFYSQLLELPVKYENNSICITAGNSEIIFDTATTTGNPFYHFAFNIPSNKFGEAFEWIQNKVELLWLDDYKSYIADFKNWHAKSFYFTDRAGNIVEFIARFDLHDVNDEPFSAAHIRNVSEIGLVFRVTEFDRQVDDLMDQYPLSYFDKQPPMPHFRAVGNDEGLFVIVPEDRVWFSTKNTRSQLYPIEIFFIENKELFNLKV
jgi:hypothetical protein